MVTADNSGRRQDVLYLKQKLADVLGDNGPLYWQALGDFITGKLNRQEFDFYANLYLDRKNVRLHNEFILANVYNALREPPPANQRSIGWSRKRRDRDPTDSDKDPIRKKLKKEVMSLGRAERERLKTILKDPSKRALVGGMIMESRPTMIKPISTMQKAQSGFQQEFQKSLQTPLCIDSKEIPDVESMKDRMTTIAFEHGLFNGLGQSTAELMLSALESHIKNTLVTCISKIRSNRAIGIVTAYGKQSHPERDRLHPSSTRSLMLNSLPTEGPKTSLSAAALALAFEISPYVLVESPAHVERLTLLSSEQEQELLSQMDEEGEHEDNEDLSDPDGGFLHLFSGIL